MPPVNSRAGNRGLGSQSASQNGQRTSQQRPFAIPTSKRRQTTPDPTTKNNKQQFSRDELAQTASGHGKRRKRNETGDSDEDMENHSPSGKAPNKRLREISTEQDAQMIDDSQAIVETHCPDSDLTEDDPLPSPKAVQTTVRKPSTSIKPMSQKASTIPLTKASTNNASQKPSAASTKSDLSLRKTSKKRDPKPSAMLETPISTQQMQEPLEHEEEDSQLQYMQASSENEDQEVRSGRTSQMKIKPSTSDQNTKPPAHSTKTTKPSAPSIKSTKPFASSSKSTKPSAAKSITSSAISGKITKPSATREPYNDVYDDLIIQEEELSRSRAASTPTLMPGSHNTSQSQGNGYVQKLKGKDKRAKDDRDTLYTGTVNMSRAEAFSKLNMMARRHYLAYLNKKNKDKPVQDTFPGLLFTDPLYIEAKKDVAKSLKQWKTDTLKAAGKFARVWILSDKHSDHLSSLRTHRELKHELSSQFQYEWLEEVFTFAPAAVDFDHIPRPGRKFLRYAFIQLVVLQRLVELQKAEPRNPDFIKYTRAHLLAVYDGFHAKDEFKDQTVDWYPQRTTPWHPNSKKKSTVDLNDDSDASVPSEEEEEESS